MDEKYAGQLNLSASEKLQVAKELLLKLGEVSENLADLRKEVEALVKELLSGKEKTGASDIYTETDDEQLELSRLFQQITQRINKGTRAAYGPSFSEDTLRSLWRIIFVEHHILYPKDPEYLCHARPVLVAACVLMEADKPLSIDEIADITRYAPATIRDAMQQVRLLFMHDPDNSLCGDNESGYSLEKI